MPDSWRPPLGPRPRYHKTGRSGFARRNVIQPTDVGPSPTYAARSPYRKPGRDQNATHNNSSSHRGIPSLPGVKLRPPRRLGHSSPRELSKPRDADSCVTYITRALICVFLVFLRSGRGGVARGLFQQPVGFVGGLFLKGECAGEGIAGLACIAQSFDALLAAIASRFGGGSPAFGDAQMERSFDAPSRGGQGEAFEPCRQSAPRFGSIISKPA